jgi:hypothetical protein
MGKKIALLVPCTSRMRTEWEIMKDTYLFRYTLKTFLATCDKEHEYVLYIGYDSGDRIFSNPEEQKVISMFPKAFKFLSVVFMEMNAPKGHLTKMWNQLFKKAYDDGCDYFYQCGDDICFETKGWVNDCISILEYNEGIGIAGPMNNNTQIITQGFVSRCHMKIFGEFFPESILNWGCDDWYNHVYQPYFCYILTNHYCSNEGGRPRYDVNGDRHFGDGYTEKVAKLRQEVKELAIKDQDKIYKFMDSNEF